MSRVPLIDADCQEAVVAEVFQKFAREGRRPIALYRAMANAPRMLRAYSGLAGALRYDASTPRALRELAILRVAQLTGSDYEWSHHRPMATGAGLAPEKIDALRHWRQSTLFSALEQATLRCADEMHALALSDAAFAALRESLDEGQAVEIVLLIAFYEAIARLIQALGIEVEDAYRQHLDGLP